TEGLPADATPSVPAEAPAFGPYETVTTLSSLSTWIERAAAAGVVAVDTETDSLDPLQATLIGFSLAISPGRACYVPLRHEAAGIAIAPTEAIAALSPLLADPAVLKVFQNAKYDLHVLAGAGIGTIAPLDDTMLISYCQAGGRHGHGMDELSALHLGHRPISYDEITGSGRTRISFAAVPLDRATAYAAEDADVTLRLWQTLRPVLREAATLALYEQLERRLIAVLVQMERAGVTVDAAELSRISVDLTERMATIESGIHRLAGHAFNVGSAKQLGEVLFSEMGLGGGKRMKTGAFGTDAQVLTALAESGHALPAQVLEWRQLQKLKSTYTDALVSEINPHTGRVHTNFVMAGTSTGRLASTDPNLQNIPIRTEEGGRIRRAFIAAPGHLLVSADYSQIELRLLAHVADIGALKDAFARGEDIHARTASEVFGVPLAGMDPLTRRRAKAINFGIIYGISAFGLARQLGIEPSEARLYIEAYFARYPGIRTYMEIAKQEARKLGFVLTPFGRRCFIDGIHDKNPARRGYAERAAINAPLQGGAADIIKRAMVRMPAALARAGLASRMVLQVHDELLFEAPAAEAEATARTAAEVMAQAATLTVPLAVETGIGGNWAEAH
ncbi:MAG: DNA polymerase I, partial [Acetobacteraceae bacterium]